MNHDDVIKWKHFPRYWPFVRGIHRSPVNSPHKGQWRGALMFSLICVWINGWVNNRKAGDLRRYRAHYEVIVMTTSFFTLTTRSGYERNLWDCKVWFSICSKPDKHVHMCFCCSWCSYYITVTQWWVRWRLKSLALRLFAQPFAQPFARAQIK